MKKIIAGIYAFCLLTMTMGFQCHRDVDYVPLKQHFKEKVNLSPAKKTYNIGDTLWMSFTTQDKTLYDSIGNQRLNSNMIRFTFGPTLVALDGTPQNPTTSLFDFVVPGGAAAYYYSTTNMSYANWYLGCDNTPKYDAKIGIIPKFKGTFLLEAFYQNNYIQPCSGVSPYPGAFIDFIFDLPDMNKDIWLSLPPSKRTNLFYEQDIDAKAAYVFNVQ